MFQILSRPLLLAMVSLLVVGCQDGVPSDPKIITTDSPERRWRELLDSVAQSSSDSIRVSEFVVTDAMVQQLSTLSTIETLVLDAGTPGDACMDVVASLPKLYHLRLRQSPITDDGLKSLSNSKTLAIINLPHADCTAKGVAHLKSLASLRQLRLGSERLGNEVSEVLSQLGTLRSLHLIGVEITDEGLKEIAALPLLQSLYLDDSQVSENGWQWLFENYPDLHVHVDQNHHDRDPQQHKH